ncbi:MAG: hypothetical protein EBZ53_06880 [Verrucomicrobia bacterium]|nr:hypothetical protein [Verrucomicrobiota bacterium]
MAVPGFKRDPIREELRRLNRESTRLGQTARRLVAESAQVSQPRSGGFTSPAVSVSRREPTLKVEGRLARRKVLLAAAVAGALAWILFRLMAGFSA